MENLGFYRVAAAIPSVRVADCKYNLEQIKGLIEKGVKERVSILLFPELAITGYSCMDLFKTKSLEKGSKEALLELSKFTQGLDIVIIVGVPLYVNNRIYDSSAIIYNGKIKGFAVKSNLSRNLQEERWFCPSQQLNIESIDFGGEMVPIGNDLIFNFKSGENSLKFAAEIGEDLWSVIPTSSFAAAAGADIIFNSSATNDQAGKHKYLLSMLKELSARAMCGYVYSSAGYGESTMDMVFGGDGFIFEKGNLLAESRRFSLEEQLIINEIDIDYLRHDRLLYGSDQEEAQFKLFREIEIESVGKAAAAELTLHREIKQDPFIPTKGEMEERCSEIFEIQKGGLIKRLAHTRCKNAVIGISGGLDSTLALLVTVEAFDALKIDRKGITAVTMPGFGTTDRTYNNALVLMRNLGVTIREISIKEACIQHFKDIGHDIQEHNVVYENSQARERTQLLMDIANQVNGMVIGTGDLSELALGWATYNGDHMSMYGVNGGVPKTLVRLLVKWYANITEDKETGNTLLDIVDTPISPELIPADENGRIKQKTEDLVGPYELHDFFLYHFMRYGATAEKIFTLAQIAFEGVYDAETIKKWLSTFLRRFFNQQFKRSCLPDGPKTGSVSISPRSDWKMATDTSSAIWLDF